MKTIIYLIASLCFDYPRSLDGLACIKEYHWYELGHKVPLQDLNDSPYRYHDIQTWAFTYNSNDPRALSAIKAARLKDNLGPKPQRKSNASR